MSVHIINPQSPKQRRVDTYGALVLAPDFSATVLVAETCTWPRWNSPL
jgi:hypothetical protein